MSVSRAPELLLAEDDRATARFLGDCMETLGCHVITRASGRDALEAARAHAFDLLLIDRHLPQMDAATLLRRLRADPAAASAAAPAIATSAEWDTASRRRMLEAGYRAVLAKPCTPEALKQTLESHVDARVWPVCHDRAALDAAGSAANLAALRRLFALELEQLEQSLPALRQDRDALCDRLHRLCASAGFCGAPALAAATRHWLAGVREGRQDDDAAARFTQALCEAREVFS